MLRSLSGTTPHLLLESLAYFIGARIYWRQAKQGPQPPSRDRFLLLGCAIFGAALGSKALHVLEHLPALVARHDAALWLGGKSALGGFLGGTLGVEIGKRLIGWTIATGDAWVWPIAVGLAIGRVGCQLSGLWDQTYGSPTALPWGWDYGDGISRHPTALYEIIGVLVVAFAIAHRWQSFAGARFAALLLSYSALRFALEFLKPPFGDLPFGVLPLGAAPLKSPSLTGLQSGNLPLGSSSLGAHAVDTLPVSLYGGLTAIQWASVIGMVWFALLLRRRLVSAVSPLPASA
jgi:prolipoprotein diacylglyceryltransferase